MESKKTVVITEIGGKRVFAYLIGEKIYDLIIDEGAEISIGDVYVGKVKKIVANIAAAFIEFRPGVMGFLPLRKDKIKHIKCEQELIVQIKKPVKGDKDVVLTDDISLTGRYLVIKPTDGLYTGRNDGAPTVFDGTLPELDADVSGQAFDISKKIKDKKQILRLSQIARSHRMEAVMIRTNAAQADEGSIVSEWESLKKKADIIALYGGQRKLYSCLYQVPPFYIRMINSYRTEDIDRIITDQKDIYDVLVEAIPERIPELYQDESYTLDARFAISSTMEKASQRLVWLKSGANIVIDRTEAMTVIDVNTAKAIEGKRASETTFLKINIEAAGEIARQLRLRNISGIVMADFVNMQKKESIDTLISELRAKLATDPVKTMYIDYTKLGIVEITRAARHQSMAQLENS